MQLVHYLDKVSMKRCSTLARTGSRTTFDYPRRSRLVYHSMAGSASSNHSITFGSKRVASLWAAFLRVGRLGQVQAGWIVRRMTVFFIPLERTNPKPACSYIVRVPL
jgi:hypothetical protein